MHLARLNDEEQLVLVGLLKLIARADHALSTAETGALVRLREHMGLEPWTAAIGRAKERFHSRDDVLAAAGAIADQQSRNLIYGELYRLAASDEIDRAEARVLHEVAELWDIAEQPGMTRVELS